jgi:hypothetical protein
MRETLAALLFAAAGVASAQTTAPAPSTAPSAERPAQPGESGLNLKLDEPAGSRPRIMFGPRPGTQGREAASTLPDLGATPGKAPSFDGPIGPSGRSGRGDGPIPKDTNPGY